MSFRDENVHFCISNKITNRNVYVVWQYALRAVPINMLVSIVFLIQE